MSEPTDAVATQADLDYDAVSDALDEAANRLANIVVARCDGCSNFGPGSIAAMRATLAAVVKVRDDFDDIEFD